MDDIVRRSALLAGGWTAKELRLELAAGRLVPVRRGAYLRNGGQLAEPVVRRGQEIRCALDGAAEGTVVSHVSAVLLHGLPTWQLPLDRVTVTRDRHGGGRVRPLLHRRAAPLDPSEVEVVDGLPVTGLARTIVDVARSCPFEQAVCVADAALALRSVPGRPPLTRAALLSALTRAKGWPGAPAAARVIAFADGRSGSVGESRSRVTMWRHRLPRPHLQWEVALPGGRSAFCDFGWPGRHTVGEFDGMAKYGRLLRPGQSPGDAVVAEKVREDGVRATGVGMVRWYWADLADFAPVAARLRATYRRARPRTP